MLTTLQLLGILLLFLAGLRLSAFFSGGETGFYRVSFLRLSIDAHHGDRIAGRILRFARNPSRFVATTLIGNNVANYLTTLSVGMAAAWLIPGGADYLEVLATLIISPVIFIFGELVPKNIYYLAPLSRLRRDINLFRVFYWLFLPVSFPLIAIARFFQRIGGTRDEPRQFLLGRNRLVQVLRQGHREGLLSDVQNWLVHGLLHTAAQRVTESMTPGDRVLGVDIDCPRDEALEFARHFGVHSIAVRRAGTEADWFAYVRVVDLAVTQRPLKSLLRQMPRIESGASKLQAMQTLREAGEAYGAVFAGETVIGVVSEHGLVEQLFRPPAVVGGRAAPVT